MKNWKLIFLEKAVLGQKTDLSNSEIVLSRCIALAYKDMMTAGRYYSKYFAHKSAEIISETRKTIEKSEFEFSRGLISEVSLLFSDSEVIGTGNKYVTRYGLAQKLVNMTFKYLYIFSDHIFLNQSASMFYKCDCPLDSIILREAGIHDCIWSKITPEQYMRCQKKISSLLNDKTVDSELKKLGNLAYDFLSW